ncbi:efflux RND transporter periplasmic adaptor subunit [Candidatus Sumerlaeota bacterium]|nr:efflux RND transporter periplasmic adaptor subunit [Candidatus Sumerlaeota bacterium]
MKFCHSIPASSRRKLFLAFLLAGVFFTPVVAQDKKADAKGAMKAAPQPALVRVGAVQRTDVPITVNAIGTVEPLMKVSIQSQVAGRVEEVLFTEGQMVKKGDILVKIDARPFEARLNELQAKLDQDRVAAKNAQWNYDRYRELESSGAVTAADLHKYEAEDASAQEAIKGSEAALASARLQVEYCVIKSPMDGRAGERMIDPGNVVKANEGTAFTQIIQVDPIWVSFSVPERYLAQIRTNQKEGALPVDAMIGGDEGEKRRGELFFIDNAVNQQTGTIRLKGRFNNSDTKLWPGSFVTVSLTVGIRKDALLVPLNAVQASQQGSVVYVVTDDMKARLVPVTVVDTRENDAVVEGKIEDRDRVIVDGHVRVVEGGAVKIVDGKPEVATAADVKVSGE